jgi:hypothetical protein
MLNWLALGRRVKKRLVLLTPLALIVPAISACGGGADLSITGSPTPTGTPIVSLLTPTPAASSTPSSSPSSAPSAAVPLGKLEELSSYRYTMRWEVTGAPSLIADRLGRACDLETVPSPFVANVTGASVDPDKLHTVYSYSGCEGELAVTIVGKEQWVKLPGSDVIGPTTFQGSLEDVNEAVAFWDNTVTRLSIPLSCAGEKQTVNSINTQHCQLTEGSMQQMAALFDVELDESRVHQMDFDVWLHESERYPVRVVIALKGLDDKDKEIAVKHELNIMDANSPEVRIDTPQ